MSTEVKFAPVVETGIVEIIGANDAEVAADEFSGSAALTLAGERSGEIVSFVLVSTETGSGAIQKPACSVLFFDADPNPTPGVGTLTAAEWKTLIGQKAIASGDWVSDPGSTGAIAFKEVAIPFHKLSAIYAVILIDTGEAPLFNSAAGDDEVLEINAWVRYDS